MTLSSRHRIRNSCPGGLRPSTLPLGHGGSPQYWLSHVDGEETFLFLSNRRDREPNPELWRESHYPRAPASQGAVYCLTPSQQNSFAFTAPCDVMQRCITYARFPTHSPRPLSVHWHYNVGTTLAQCCNLNVHYKIGCKMVCNAGKDPNIGTKLAQRYITIVHCHTHLPWVTKRTLNLPMLVQHWHNVVPQLFLAVHCHTHPNVGTTMA